MAPACIVALALAAGKSWFRPAVLIGCVLELLDFVNAAAFMTSILTDYQSLKEIVIFAPLSEDGQHRYSAKGRFKTN